MTSSFDHSSFDSLSFDTDATAGGASGDSSAAIFRFRNELFARSRERTLSEARHRREDEELVLFDS